MAAPKVRSRIDDLRDKLRSDTITPGEIREMLRMEFLGVAIPSQPEPPPMLSVPASEPSPMPTELHQIEVSPVGIRRTLAQRLGLSRKRGE